MYNGQPQAYHIKPEGRIRLVYKRLISTFHFELLNSMAWRKMQWWTNCNVPLNLMDMQDISLYDLMDKVFYSMTWLTKC